MDTTNQAAWETLTPEEKRRALYDRQVATLATFLEHGASCCNGRAVIQNYE